MMFVDCPAYLDQDGAARWGLPAEVRCRYIMRSTDGPLESAIIRCPAGHWFNGPIESLTRERADSHDPGAAAAGSRAGRDSPPGTRDGGDGGGGSVLRDDPAAPERPGRRPDAAPAYYLGRPAGLWIALMRPRRRQTPSSHPDQPVTGGTRTPSLPGGALTDAGAETAWATPALGPG
jgi:hypothetical protein